MGPVYAALAVLGALVPLSVVLPWLAYNGLDWRLFAGELLASRPGRFLALDLLIVSLVTLLAIVQVGRRERLPSLWLPFLVTCTIGASCGLPLFLAIRESTLRRR